jgi:hypothetical protein
VAVCETEYFSKIKKLLYRWVLKGFGNVYKEYFETKILTKYKLVKRV